MTVRATFLAGVLLLALTSPSPLFAQTIDHDSQPDGRAGADEGSSVQVQVTPRQTQVYIDGYYAGIADDFDGAFQRLRIESGAHEIQLFLTGHRLFAQQVNLQPGGSLKIRHSMERLVAGEAEPTRPVAPPRPPHARGSAPSRPPTPGEPPADDQDPERQDQRDQDREPPITSAQPAAESHGAIDIQVQQGDAQVFIDGARWNTTGDDHLLVQLAPGPHTVEVRKRGYRVYLTEVTVNGGQTLPLGISLTKE